MFECIQLNGAFCANLVCPNSLTGISSKKEGINPNWNREERKEWHSKSLETKTIPLKLLLLSSPPEETEQATPAVFGVKDQTDAQVCCSMCDILPEL